MKTVKAVRFDANKQLPNSLTPQQFSFDALLSRGGDNVESMDFPDPTFTGPTIMPDHKSVKFDICLSPGSQIPPGKYVGSVTLSGPPGLSAASVSITANLKRPVFWFWLVRALGALGLAVVLLVLKDAAAYKKKISSPTWWTWKLWLHPFQDAMWLASTGVALIATFGALYSLYANDVAWGAKGFADFTAMIGATFAAVGGQTIISTITPSSDQP